MRVAMVESIFGCLDQSDGQMANFSKSHFSDWPESPPFFFLKTTIISTIGATSSASRVNPVMTAT